MCTFTYLPIAPDEFIATSNRDEQPDRAANDLIPYLTENGLKLLFPQDPKAGGTWLATSADKRLVTVLNGAFERHQRQPFYRRSRGLMVLDFFEYPGAQQFLHGYDFDGIEPFTMIIYDKGNLIEYRWDGDTQYIKSLRADVPQLWSSPTLYTAEARALRQGWFEQWLTEKHPFTQSNILQFHANTGKDDLHNGLVMNRFNMVKTVSITSILKTSGAFDWHYQNLVNPQILTQSLSIV
jgi:hypothetical protein